MTRPLREGLTAHEEVEVGDVCKGCFWRSPSCLLWKYRTPRSCKAMIDLLESEPTTHHSSSPKVFVTYLEVVRNYDWKSKRKEYDYIRMKSVDGRTVSRRKSTWRAYHEWLAKQKEATRPKNIYDQAKRKDFVPPANPYK